MPPGLGWLKPSEVITGQEIPPGGFPEQPAGLLEKWGVELGLGSLYVFGGTCALVFALKKDKPTVLVMYGSLMIVAGWVLSSKGTRVSYALFLMAALTLGVVAFQCTRRSKKSPPAHHGR